MRSGAGVERFNHEERVQQLLRLRELSLELADLCAGRHPNLAAAYAGIASAAKQVLQEGFDQRRLNQLSSEWPFGPDWLHPKHPGYDAPWDEAQERIADLHREGQELAVDIRAIGTVTED